MDKPKLQEQQLSKGRAVTSVENPDSKIFDGSKKVYSLHDGNTNTVMLDQTSNEMFVSQLPSIDQNKSDKQQFHATLGKFNMSPTNTDQLNDLANLQENKDTHRKQNNNTNHQHGSPQGSNFRQTQDKDWVLSLNPTDRNLNGLSQGQENTKRSSDENKTKEEPMVQTLTQNQQMSPKQDEGVNTSRVDSEREFSSTDQNKESLDQHGNKDENLQELNTFKTRDLSKLDRKAQLLALELDNMYAQFKIGEKKVLRLTKKSFYIFGEKNQIRKMCVHTVTSKTFENFVTVMIVLNSILLAVHDHADRENETEYNQKLLKFDHFFSYFFIGECILKNIAYGFLIGKDTYLNDAWNILDFFVVIISVFELIPSFQANSSLKGLRTARILRPLRSINTMPSMKKLIQALLTSLKNLINVILFLIFIFMLFGIFGINSFQGQLYNRCRDSEVPIYDDDGQLYWPILYDVEILCIPGENSICSEYTMSDGQPSICGHPQDYDLSLSSDNVSDQELIFFNIVNFDNLAISMITIFQILTMEGWTNMMYNFMDTNQSKVLVVIYFCMVILFGSFFVMNLILATIMDSFDKQQEDEVDLDINEELREQEASSTNTPRHKNHNINNDIKVDATVSDPSINKSEQKIVNASPLSSILKSIKDNQPDVNQRRSSQTVQDIDHKQESTNQDQEIDKAMKDVNNKSPFEILDQLTGTQAEKQTDADKQPLAKQSSELPNIHTKQFFGESKQSKTELQIDPPVKNLIKKSQEQNKSKDQVKSLKASRCKRLMNYLYEDEEQKQLPNRAHRNKFYYVFYKLCMSRIFSSLIFIFIIMNTIVLAMDRYPITLQEDQKLYVYNHFFSYIFTGEMVIKLIGLGVKGYIQDGFNIFDGTIVILNLMDLIIFGILSLEGLSNASIALQSFRCIRLLRVVKLARGWTALQRIIVNTGKSIKDIANFSLLLFLFIFIFNLLGMELFAYKVRQDFDGHIINVDGVNDIYHSESPRANFDTFFYGFMSIFIVIIGEDWNSVMYSHYRSLGPAVQIYFVVLLVFGNFILLSLFTAILLKNFENDTDTEKELILREKEKERKKAAHKTAIASTLSHMIHGVIQQDEDISVNLSQEEHQQSIRKKESKISQMRSSTHMQSLGPNVSQKHFLHQSFGPNTQKSFTRKFNDNFSLTQFHQEGKSFQGPLSSVIQLEGKSLHMFSPQNKIRKFLNAMIHSKSFDNFILLLIIVSTCFLALENPLTDPDGELMKFLQIADKIMTILFVVEMVVKVIALGFMFNGKDSYIKNGWNQLDFMIVIASIIILANNNTNFKFIKALRIFRVLRPLRMIQRQKGLKVAVISMINAIPDIINLQMIVLFVFFLMGILGTTFFKGKMNFCNTEKIWHEDTLDFIHLYGHSNTNFSKWDCINSGGEWLRHELNFDNILYSVQTLFILQSTEGWVDMLWTGIDASDIDYIPIRDNQPQAFFFFMMSIILFSLFFLNLFVGVVIDTFKREKDILSRNSELNVDQREWISIYTMILQSQPKLKFNKTGNRLVDTCRAFVQHYLFDVVILICIILNTMVLAFTWYGESQATSQITSTINTYFNIIFTIEAIIKIIGLKKFYFYDGWNVFDFVIVIGTWIVLVYGSIMGSTNLSTQATLLRTFRIGRVFRVVKRFKDLKIIFNTLIESIPSLASVGGLLMLLFFLYAIMGNFLFSTVMLNNSLGPHVNFQDFGTAFLLLFRMSTGESWFQIMFDYSRTYNHMYQCEDDVDFYTIKENGGNINGCGKPVAAMIYFVSFQMIVSQIFLNLFIAIIIEAFGDQNEIESMSLQSEDILCFQDSWKEFDPNATGFIKVRDFEPLILHICKQDSNLIPIKSIILRYPRARRLLMIKMKNPSFFNFTKYSYYDTLKKLAEHKCELKFCIQKISTAKKCIHDKIQEAGGDIKENKFQKLLEMQLTKLVAVKESDDFDVFLNEIKEADQEIEIVGQMIVARRKVYKKIGQYLDFKHGQIFDSQHQIMVPLIQQHIRKNVIKKKQVDEDGEFLSFKKNQQSSSAINQVLGITDSELITRTTSYQPSNDQKLLSQLSIARSSNTNNTQQIGQFKSSHQSSIQKGDINDSYQTHKTSSPVTKLYSDKSHQANQNMLITENYADSMKIGSGEINVPTHQQGTIVHEGVKYGRLPTINSVKSGETETVQNIGSSNQKIDFKGDIIYEKQNEDSLLEELDDQDYHLISKDNSHKKFVSKENKQVQEPKNKIDFASIQKSKSSRLSNNFVEGDEIEDPQSLDISHFDQRNTSKDRQNNNDSINHMIEDAGFDINGKQLEHSKARNQNQKIGQKQVFLRQITPLKNAGNQEKNTLDRIQEENIDQQETQLQNATGTQLRLESQILDDYQNADVAVIKGKKQRQIDTIDQLMINQSGDLDSLDQEHKQKERDQKISNQHNKQLNLQNKFTKPK